jgi:hypothetical protein
MNTTEIRIKVANYMEVGFTMKEAFEGIRNARKKEGRKQTTTDKIAESKQAQGAYEYGNFGKEYAKTKWGS